MFSNSRKMSSPDDQELQEKEREERERVEHPSTLPSSGQAPKAVSTGATAADASLSQSQ